MARQVQTPLAEVEMNGVLGVWWGLAAGAAEPECAAECGALDALDESCEALLGDGAALCEELGEIDDDCVGDGEDACGEDWDELCDDLEDAGDACEDVLGEDAALCASIDAVEEQRCEDAEDDDDDSDHEDDGGSTDTGAEVVQAPIHPAALDGAPSGCDSSGAPFGWLALAGAVGFLRRR